MANNQHNYPFQTGYRAHGRSSHPGQPRPQQTPSPSKPAPKNKGLALFIYAVSVACLCFGTAVAVILVRRAGLPTLLGLDVEVIIMTSLGAGFIAVALRHAPRTGGFSKLAQETIATVFFLAVGATLAMDMSQAALQAGMLATLIAALAIIFVGFLLYKAYP
ncbi:MAG: hypothetical protein EOM92_15195 [Gammaproteobacteria bacterium]|nr:hypothetical protein [Gammaproteobacteria bacterium]